MENCGNLGTPAGNGRCGLMACSACAGDYEDPDRTAWCDDEEVDEADEVAAAADVDDAERGTHRGCAVDDE